jgi:2-polyprenyl-3-methyl-5-hydroxy-6-metoxy-1,4-benzoquinol methylase
MNESQEIRSFFDAMSVDRDQAITGDPRLQYEQTMRHQAVDELLEANSCEYVLDVGAGNLRDSIPLLRRGVRVHAMDLSARMLQEGLRSVGAEGSPLCVQGSAMSLPFPDESFDRILCSEVIEHIPGFEAVFPEFHRCLRPGGVLVITTPNWNSLYGLNRKLVEIGQELLGHETWQGHPYDEWKRPGQLEQILSTNRFRVDRWIGICYLPGFSFGALLSHTLQGLAVRVVQAIEPTVRSRAAKWGYGIGVRALKV